MCDDLSHDTWAVKVNCESQSAIFLVKNRGFYKRTKHIRTKFNFIWNVIADGSRIMV